MLSILEFIKHIGEQDLDNSIREQYESLKDIINKLWQENIPPKSFCTQLRPLFGQLKLLISQWLMKPENAAKFLAVGTTKYELTSSDYPYLQNKFNQYFLLLSTIGSDTLNKLQTLAATIDIQSPKKMQELNFAFYLAVDLEILLLLAQIIISEKINQPQDWINELQNQLDNTFIFYIAVLIRLKFYRPSTQQINDYPVLNNARIWAGEFGFSGLAKAKSLHLTLHSTKI